MEARLSRVFLYQRRRGPSVRWNTEARRQSQRKTIDEAEPTEERAAGKCPDCGAPVWIYLSRTQRMQ